MSVLLYFIFSLFGSFSICRKIKSIVIKLQGHQSVLMVVYKCFIESIRTFNVFAWVGLLALTLCYKLIKLIRTSRENKGQEH